MKCVALLFLCAVASGSAGTAAASDHPIVKVIKMLDGLKEKAIGEGQAEAVAYEKFTYWCSTSKAELQAAITDEKESIDELDDTIAGKQKEEESLKDKIEKLEDQLTELAVSEKSAKDDRAAEAKLYTEANADLASTVKAVDDCIKALEGAQTGTEGKLLLAQRNVMSLIALVSTQISNQQLDGLKKFAARPDQLAEGDLGKHTDKYDFKSENVIELLKQLKLKFEDDQTSTTKAETNAQNSYDLSKSARDNTIAAADKSKTGATKALASTRADLLQATTDRKNTQDDLDADSKSLSTTDDSCRTKKSEWEARSETRKLEVQAMDAAIDILGKASGVRTKAPGNPIPPPAPVKLLLVETQSVSDPKMKAVVLLRQAAKDAHSKALERLALEVAAHLNGPFDSVNNMIEKMIFRLMDEQKNEDEHKLWCDQETKKTKTMKENKDDKISELSAEIKVQNAAVNQLTEDIKDAAKMISDITGFQKEATEIRNTGKQENKLALKDSQDAQKAVSNAIAVLEQFYKDSGSMKKEAWELLQQPVVLPKNPNTWDSSYTEVADPKKQPNGIITVLEAVSADFSQMAAQTKSQETVDQKDYEESMKANAIEKARRTKESEMKSAEKARRVGKITSLEGAKKDTSAELEKTVQYLDDLKPACSDGDSSYTDRKAARTKEVAALKNAQVILLDAFKEGNGKFLQARPVSRHQ